MVYLSGADRPAFVQAVTETAGLPHLADKLAQQDAALYRVGNRNSPVRALTGEELTRASGGVGLLAAYGLWRAGYPRHGVPLRFDSEAYRARRGTYRRRFAAYCTAIDEHRPDSYAAWDYIPGTVLTEADLDWLPHQTRGEYAHLVGHAIAPEVAYALTDLGLAALEDRGYAPIPVWQVRGYDRHVSPETNAAVHAGDPTLRCLCAAYPTVAVGGLVRGPVPLSQPLAGVEPDPANGGLRHRCSPIRGRYLVALMQSFPGVRFWLMGQGNDLVLNELARHPAIMERVEVDTTRWLHAAVCSDLLLVHDGQLVTLFTRKLRSPDQRRQGPWQHFFPRAELMRCNIRTYAAWANGTLFRPNPPPIPRDPAQLRLALA
ncbi:MAG: hypothetical protein KKA73_18640 [Chloroflexi bacterium]|nr:hypothetical protein [Chloroflexota bacterium]